MRTPARKAWSNDNDRFKVRIFFLGERFFCLGELQDSFLAAGERRGGEFVLVSGERRGGEFVLVCGE